MDEIKKWTLMKDEIETGGELFGLWIDKHTAVVQFVLGPGQYCRRTPVSFFQDTKYLESVCRKISFINLEPETSFDKYFIWPVYTSDFVAIFLILTHAIEWLSHKSIDLYSFAQMV